jgi:hypothetical protein
MWISCLCLKVLDLYSLYIIEHIIFRILNYGRYRFRTPASYEQGRI